MNWTKEQELAINETGKSIIVSAGAGSGKTAVLTNRVVEKIKNGTDIRRLLILTFTNLAASEMKDRIMKKLKEEKLNEQLKYLSSAYITTFDSFTLSLVKKYHTLLNLSKDISIMDNSIETLKLNEIVDSVFDKYYNDSKFTNFIESFSSKTDDNIKEVIKNLYSKVSTIVDSDYLDNYISEYYSESYITNIIDKYLSIINLTILEIKDNYNNLVKYVDDKYLSTFNLEPLLDSTDYDSIKSALELIGSPRKNNNCDPLFKEYKDEISNLIKKLENLVRFSNIDEIRGTYLSTRDNVEVIIRILKEIDRVFSEYKNKYNLYTFSDIALLGIKLLKENSTVRKEVMNSFDEIMIDEYQDTSDIEEEFISLISNNNLYMVGDIKQSIYRFRNANPKIFKDKYNSGIFKIDLLKNFRSRSEVLNNINLIFNLIMDSEIGDAEYKESHQMYYGNSRYDKESKQDYNMEILTYDKSLNKDYNTDEIEAFTVALDIKNKIDNKYQILDKDTYRDALYSDFCIIMDRGTSFDLYKKVFEYLGIPLEQIKNEKLTVGDDIIVLKNLLSLIIKVYENNLDNEFKYYFVSIARSYLYRLSDEEIFDIVSSNSFKDTDIYKTCKSIDISEMSSLDLLNTVIDKFNIYSKLITTNNIKESIIRLDYLKTLSTSLSKLGYTPVMFTEYLSDMILDGSIEYSLNSGESNSVRILNIHKSKGLEYNVCYYTGLSKRINESDIKAKFLVGNSNNIIIPYINDGLEETIEKDIFLFDENKESISEKIRLLYVALTRAKEKIIIVSPIEEKDSFDTLVPKVRRLGYKRLSDMLESIYTVLKPYIKIIDLDKLNLTKDYEDIKVKDYKDKIGKSNIKITLKENNITYNVVSSDKYSKEANKLITLEEYENMKYGTKLHYEFENEDFKTTTNPNILKFLKHIDINYINCYKEYEFMYYVDNIVKHGIIDLMLEYDDHIDIIDYKTNDIEDEHYKEQLKGYKEYISTLTNKDINIYLYSIAQDKLEKIKEI